MSGFRVFSLHIYVLGLLGFIKTVTGFKMPDFWDYEEFGSGGFKQFDEVFLRTCEKSMRSGPQCRTKGVPNFLFQILNRNSLYFNVVLLVWQTYLLTLGEKWPFLSKIMSLIFGEIFHGSQVGLLKCQKLGLVLILKTSKNAIE